MVAPHTSSSHFDAILVEGLASSPESMHHTSGPEIRLAQLSQPQIFVANMQETNETKETNETQDIPKKSERNLPKEVLFWCLA